MERKQKIKKEKAKKHAAHLRSKKMETKEKKTQITKPIKKKKKQLQDSTLTKEDEVRRKNKFSKFEIKLQKIAWRKV